MSRQTIGENLQRLLKLHGDLSLSDLSRETKIPQPTLHHIVDGKTKKPRRQALEALAKFFSITVSQLIGATSFSPTIPDVIKESLKISTVPLIDWCFAKNWDVNKHDLSKFDEIILDRQVDRNSFALQLENSSMEPFFQEKSILIFDPSKMAKERDFVLSYFYNSDSLIFNRLFIEGKNFYIKRDKEDGNAELIKLSLPNDRIVATLIEARLHF